MNNTGIDVTIIDTSDHVGLAAALTRTHELTMNDVSSMVRNLLAYLHPYARRCDPQTRNPRNKLRRLNILDHGNAHGIQMGTDRIDGATLPHFPPILRPLASSFATWGCNVEGLELRRGIEFERKLRGVNNNHGDGLELDRHPGFSVGGNKCECGVEH